MKIFFDTDKRADYDFIDNNTTVQDLLDAVELFLNNNPLPCNECNESCCKKAWAVGVDNISVNRLCNWDREASIIFVRNNLKLKRNYLMDFLHYAFIKDECCRYITDSNRCKIYQQRPLICRLYICCDKSTRYNKLREIIASTYLRALVMEYRINSHNYMERTIKKYKRNPAVFAANYDISLNKIVEFAEDEGWLDFDEKLLLYQVIH